MPNPIRIAQISDLHVKPPGQLAYGRVDTAKALQRCVATLNAFKPAPDFVVISGDLADTPVAEEYEYLAQLLAALKLPFAGIPGNHDGRDIIAARFRAPLMPRQERSIRRSRSGRLTSCCWIRACLKSRTASSMHRPCNGLIGR